SIRTAPSSASIWITWLSVLGPLSAREANHLHGGGRGGRRGSRGLAWRTHGHGPCQHRGAPTAAIVPGTVECLQMQTLSELPTFELDGERFIRPDFSGRGLANVAPTVLRLLAPEADELDLPPLSPEVLPPSLTTGVRHVVLLIADGLGHHQLQREIARGNAPHLGEPLAQATAGHELVSYQPITSVFPTTTVSALGSVNSAVTPAEHGLLSYTIYLPEFEMVAEMIRWGPLNRRISFTDP